MKFFSIATVLLCSIFALHTAHGQRTASLDGKLDRSYGENGIALAGPFPSLTGDIALLNDGSIVGAHQTHFNGKFVLILSKQLPDGRRDESFGKFGFRMYEFPTSINIQSLAVQPDGKFVAAGSSTSISDPAQIDFFALRIGANGNIDTTFGNNGTIIKDFTPAGSEMISSDRASSVIVQPDGKIVIAGAVDQYSPGQTRASTYAAMLRVDQSGIVDPSFGVAGVSLTSSGNNQVQSLGARPVAAKRLGNGNIILGETVQREIPGSGGVYANRPIIRRYGPDGLPDTGFAENGEKDLSIDPAGTNDSFFVNIHELPSERLIVLTSNGLVQLTPDGSFDKTFGQNGRAHLGPRVCYPIDLTVVNNGRIVVNRSCSLPMAVNGFRWIVVTQRYWQNGLLDVQYGNRGETVVEGNEIDLFPGRMLNFQDKFVLVSGYRGLPGMSTPFIIKIHARRKP